MTSLHHSTWGGHTKRQLLGTDRRHTLDDMVSTNSETHMYTWGRNGTSRECQHAVQLLENATRCGTHPIKFDVQVLTLKPCLICVLVFSLFSLICCFHTSLWRTLWPLLLSVGEEPPSSVMLEEASLYASSYPSYLQGPQLPSYA